MIFHRLGLIHKNQRGVTLVELIIAVAITGIITGGITMTIFQVFGGNERTSNHMTAIRQVQNAGYWISHDTQMAQEVNDNPTAPEVLILTWTEWDNTAHQVTYTLQGTELWRDDSGQQLRVAQYIESISCQFAGGKLTLTVTATVGGWKPASETRVYEIIPRPGS